MSFHPAHNGWNGELQLTSWSQHHSLSTVTNFNAFCFLLNGHFHLPEYTDTKLFTSWIIISVCEKTCLHIPYNVSFVLDNFNCIVCVQFTQCLLHSQCRQSHSWVWMPAFLHNFCQRPQNLKQNAQALTNFLLTVWVENMPHRFCQLGGGGKKKRVPSVTNNYHGGDQCHREETKKSDACACVCVYIYMRAGKEWLKNIQRGKEE